MMGDLKPRQHLSEILERGALPYAPMAMPEQTLSRKRSFRVLQPLLQWLALK